MAIYMNLVIVGHGEMALYSLFRCPFQEAEAKQLKNWFTSAWSTNLRFELYQTQSISECTLFTKWFKVEQRFR